MTIVWHYKEICLWITCLDIGKQVKGVFILHDNAHVRKDCVAVSKIILDKIQNYLSVIEERHSFIKNTLTIDLYLFSVSYYL